MKKMALSIITLAATALLFSCQSSGGGTGNGGKVSPQTFDSLITALPDEQILDVRTPGEYAGGFIAGAINADWNGDFQAGIAGLDKNKPVMVYCLAGGRSSAAADQLRSSGFKTVYELEGGVRNWSVAGKSLTQGAPAAAPTNDIITPEKYNTLINSSDLVLVDFSAVWCGPCKILAPRLHELESERGSEFKLVTVDADRDADVANQNGITALPTLILYKGGKVVWRSEGLVEKSLVAAKLDENK